MPTPRQRERACEQLGRVASEDVPATDDPNLTDAQARKLHQATRVQTRSSISAFMRGNVRRRWTMVRIVSQVLAFHNPDPNNPNKQPQAQTQPRPQAQAQAQAQPFASRFLRALYTILLI